MNNPVLNVKLTKIESNHNNLRTNDMVGTTAQIPEVGHEFIILGESLSFKGGARVIHTTEIKDVKLDLANKKMTFQTQNSTYDLEVLDKDLSDDQILDFGANRLPKGALLICIEPIEGYITESKYYEFQGIESYAGRVVTTDDNGKEGHFKPERFVVPTRGFKKLSEVVGSK